MINRRRFLRQVVRGAAWAASSGLFVSGRVQGSNERIGIGLIGSGSRGMEIFRTALRCPNVTAVAVADVYARRLDEAKAAAPQIATHKDFRRLLDDKSIDAVCIATPDHWHRQMILDAIAAGKDVYAEKPMTFRSSEGIEIVKSCKGVQNGTRPGDQPDSAVRATLRILSPLIGVKLP